MKVWYSFEFDEFLLQPKGRCVNQYGEDFIEGVDTERDYIECHELNVEDGTTVYLSYSYQDYGKVITRMDFQSCLNNLHDKRWNEIYEKKETKYNFNGYDVIECKHRWDYHCWVMEVKWKLN